MEATNNHKQNRNTNGKKRKLDASNGKNQPSKKQKVLPTPLQNLFNKHKELKNEIKLVTQERDKEKKERDYIYNQMIICKQMANKYDQIYSKMLAIVQASENNTDNDNANNRINGSHSLNMIQQPPKSFNNCNATSRNNGTFINDACAKSNNNNQKTNEIIDNLSDNDIINEPTDNKQTHKKQLFDPELESIEYENDITTTPSPIHYLKNGYALNGHNDKIHTIVNKYSDRNDANKGYNVCDTHENSKSNNSNNKQEYKNNGLDSNFNDCKSKECNQTKSNKKRLLSKKTRYLGPSNDDT